MANALMARFCFPGIEGSPWLGTWDVTVASTYAESHLAAPTLTAAAAADKATANKEMKYT